MLYSRLVRMKEVSDELEGTKPRSEVKNHIAMELGFRKDARKVLLVIPLLTIPPFSHSCSNYNDREG